MSAHVYRVAIANVDEEHIIDVLENAGYAGTIQPDAIGFSSQWGKETGSVLEVATERCTELIRLLAEVLAVEGESAAYLTVDGGNPQLLLSSGTLQPLTDHATTQDQAATLAA